MQIRVVNVSHLAGISYLEKVHVADFQIDGIVADVVRLGKFSEFGL
jgi:hypothetical protein